MEQNSKYYDEVYRYSEDYKVHYRRSPYYPIWNVFVKNMNPKMRIVDLGCGPGQFAKYLRDESFQDYIGIDFSHVAIDMAKKLVPDYTFICADLNTCPLPDADYYVLSEVLEHLEKDIALIQKIPFGKKVVASVPCFDNPAHVRTFKNINDVTKRYGKYVVFDVLGQVGLFFVFSGEMKREF